MVRTMVHTPLKWFGVALSLTLLLWGCEDTKYNSGIASDLPDALTGMDADPDHAAMPDDVSAVEDGGAIVEGPSCVVSIQDEIGPWTCDLRVRTGRGCDEFARCLCQYAIERLPQDESLDLDSCIASIVVPRGALTLADFCALSGTSSEVPNLPDAVEMFTQGTFPILPQHMAEIRFSEACEQIASFSLWGEEPGWNMSLGFRGEEALPDVSLTALEAYPIEVPPLLTIDNLLSYHDAEATARLTPEGAERFASRIADPELTLLDLIGWTFLIHTDSAPIMTGKMWSMAISAITEGPLLHIEGLEETHFSTLRFELPPPGGGPAHPPTFHRSIMMSHLAATGRLLDARCISTCGCPQGRACQEGVCEALEGGCASDADCCLGRCGSGGVCESP